MNRNLGYAAVTVVCNDGTAAGTTSVNGSSVNMTGFESVRFVALLGTLTSTQVTELKAQGSNDNSTWTDLANTHTGPAADGDSGKTLILDLFRPQYTYVRPVLVRGTANAVLQGIIADLYLAHWEPVTADTSNSATNVQAYPAAGTA